MTTFEAGPRELTACPACGGGAATPVERVDVFEMVRCTACGLEYTRNPEPRLEDYDRTYAGASGVLVDAHVYESPAMRLALESRAWWVPPPYLTPAERWILARLRERLPTGARVLDVGCGTGRMLRALRRAGLEAVGVDPAASVVAELQRQGLKVDVGAMPGLPDGLGDMDAVVAFEVVEHLPDPRPALRELKERFPRAIFAGSVPSPRRWQLASGRRGASDYPPNHYLRWTPAALEHALQAAGWSRIVVHFPPPVGVEFLPGFGRVVRRMIRQTGFSKTSSGTATSPAISRHSGGSLPSAKATIVLLAQRGWHAFSAAIGAPQAFIASCRGLTSASMGFWAEG